MGNGWTTVTNFRELGGLTTEFGRRVRAGVLYRSGALHKLSAAEQQRLLGLGVTRVLDLRSADEAAQEPDLLPDGIAYARMGALQMLDDPSDDPIDLLDWDAFLVKALSGEAGLSKLESFQHGVYPSMASRPDAFRALVQMLLDRPGAPVLFHCTAGKDRTGLAAAILERLLGVPYPTILADYLESDRILAPLNRTTIELLRTKTSNERVIALVQYMLGVTREQLELAFAQLDVTFGGWDGFVRDGLGLTVDDVTALQNALLTD